MYEGSVEEIEKQLKNDGIRDIPPGYYGKKMKGYEEMGDKAAQVGLALGFSRYQMGGGLKIVDQLKVARRDYPESPFMIYGLIGKDELVMKPVKVKNERKRNVVKTSVQ